MDYPIEKLIGVYQIKNRTNGKVYIGHSVNMIIRWSLHLNRLKYGTHDNHKLQADFDTYGIHVFEFSILNLCDSKQEAVNTEQTYLNSLDFENNYNLVNSKTHNMPTNEELFIDYINNKWLIPKGITTRKELNKYKIYKEEDKKEIIKMVVKCNLLKLYFSQITFKKVLELMKNNLGYTIESHRGKISNEKHTYKLITGFNADKTK